jgi:TPR repeat protein
MKKFYVALLLALFCVFAGGTTVSAEPSAYVKSLIKNAEKGDAEAQFWLGFNYFLGEEGVLQDYQKAKKWYEKAAKQGHVDAQYNLGCCYGKGVGVSKDTNEATKWIRKAAEQGHDVAKQQLEMLENSTN